MKRRTALLVMLSVINPILASAAGLQWDIPIDGTWVRYDIDGERVEADGTKRKVSGTFTISCVGKMNTDDQPCRWIEAALVLNEDAGPTRDIVKVLVDDKYLTKGEEPIKHIRRAWSKAVYEGKTKIQPIPLKYARDFLNERLGFYLGGTLDSEEKIDAKAIDTILGTLKCDGIKKSKTTKIELENVSFSSRYSIWSNVAAPFGVISIVEQTTKEQDGKPSYSLNQSYKLAATGVDAKTEILERN